MQQQTIDAAPQDAILFNPGEDDLRVTGWLGYLVMGPTLLLAGFGLLWRALSLKREGQSVPRWAGLGSAAVSAIATGAAFIAEGERSRRLYETTIDAGE